MDCESKNGVTDEEKPSRIRRDLFKAAAFAYPASQLAGSLWGCAAIPADKEISASIRPQGVRQPPLPYWGVTLLSWSAGELPVGYSWKAQTWTAATPSAVYRVTKKSFLLLQAVLPESGLKALAALRAQAPLKRQDYINQLQKLLGVDVYQKFKDELLLAGSLQKGALGVQSVTPSTQRKYRGQGALELQLNLKPTQTHCNGEAWVDVRNHPPKCTRDRCRHVRPGEPLDLTGASVTAFVCEPKGAIGDKNRPNGMTLFSKSVRATVHKDAIGEMTRQEAWNNYYGSGRDFVGKTDWWHELSMIPGRRSDTGHMDSGFDARQVGILGIKIEIHESSVAKLKGSVILDEVRIRWPDGCEAVYDFDSMDNSIEELGKTGVNLVALIPTWYMSDATSTEIHPNNRFTGASTHSDQELERTIQEFHSRGFKVLLKPHVDCESCEPPDNWRGHIQPKSSKEWFASYRKFILHYATLAAKHKVALFSVGTELDSMQHHDAEWRGVIADVRRSYPQGTLTYAANWSNQDPKIVSPGFKGVKFWNDLDIIGIDGYFPLAEKGVKPSSSDLVRRWRTHVEQIRAWQTIIEKPVVFTEVGYRSSDTAAVEPYAVSGGQANEELQKLCYEATKEVLTAEKYRDFLVGVVWWGWYPYDVAAGPCDASYSPQRKAAQRVL